MMNSQELFEMSQVDIVNIDRSTIADINSITINQGLPHKEKILSYIAQMGNPYCFLSSDIPVRMRFVAEDKSLSQLLINFFSQLKQK